MKRTPLHRRTPLRRVSLKRQRVMQQRRMFVAEQLALRPDCEAGPLIRTGNEAVAGIRGDDAVSEASRRHSRTVDEGTRRVDPRRSKHGRRVPRLP